MSDVVPLVVAVESYEILMFKIRPIHGANRLRSGSQTTKHYIFGFLTIVGHLLHTLVKQRYHKVSNKTSWVKHMTTRMHSSMMRTVRCSGRQGGVSAQGVYTPWTKR